jgi:hypothetical protein
LQKIKTKDITPAKAGVQSEKSWIPAFAGMTNMDTYTSPQGFLMTNRRTISATGNNQFSRIIDYLFRSRLKAKFSRNK